MKPKIGMITLGVRDLAKSLRFYRDGLGFPMHRYKDGDDMIMFRLEGSFLGLYPRHKLAEDAAVPDEGSGCHNVKSKSDADAVFALAVAAGARPAKKPQDAFWGGYSGYFADPTAISGRSRGIRSRI